MSVSKKRGRLLSPGVIRNLILGVLSLAIMAFMSYWKLWVFGALIVGILLLLTQMRRSKHRAIPEPSPRLRVIAFGAQALSIITLAYVTVEIWHIALLSIAILAAGHYFAYKYRNHPPYAMRVGAFVGLHLAFFWMFYGLSHGQPFPQAQVAMLALAIVSYEMFSRLNLYSGMGIGIVNLYVSATLSRDVIFGAFLLAFVGCILVFLWQADNEDGVKDNPVILHPVGTPVRSRLPTFGGGRNYVALLVVCIPLVFLFTPHYAGYPIVPPVSVNVPMLSAPTSGIINPAIPLVQVSGWSNQVGEYYYGFDNRLDLSYRGGLSNTIMMYVRSPAPGYWRSHAFDFYDGHTWTQTDTSLKLIDRQGSAFTLASEGNWFVKDYFVQTYYIVQPLPNTIFTAWKPIQLYIAANEIGVDRTDGIHLGSPLEQNSTYSVLSIRQNFTPETLRSAGGQYPLDILAFNLQIPDTVTARTRALAHELTDGAAIAYDKVVILRDYLKHTYPYDYFPPPQQPSTDSVDQFLFVDKRGVCEHYVSALVVMLRSLGIPARLAAGFGTGTYNPITGYYEVHANDAHAWAEVYFPNVGWVPIDPTPGWNGDPQVGPVQRWVFSSLLTDINLPSLPIASIALVGASAISLISVPVIFGVIVVMLILVGRRLLRMLKWQAEDRRRYGVMRRDPARKRILGVYQRAQRQIRSYRTPTQTVQEHTTTEPQLGDLADLVDVAAYRPQPPDDDQVSQALTWKPKHLSKPK